MPFSGTTFTKIYNWLAELIRNEKIFNARLDDELSGIATGLTQLATGAVGPGGNAIQKDGSTTTTASIPFQLGATLGSSPPAGDNTLKVPTTAWVNQATAESCGRLIYVSPTQIKFIPFNGDRIKINGLWEWIPAAGITLANTSVIINGAAGQNLVADNDYLVAISGGGTTLTFWGPGAFSHAPSTTPGNVGTEIVAGSDSISLVGMIRANGSAQFFDMGVVSWFNRRTKVAKAAITSTTTTTSTTPGTELTTALRVPFATWAEEGVVAIIGGAAYPSALVNARIVCSISFDSGPTEAPRTTLQAETTNQSYKNMAVTVIKNLSEGGHYATMWAFVGNTQTGTFDLENPATVMVITQG